MEATDLQAVIFDLDGTLVDSERDGHRVAFNRAFEAAGLVDRWDVRTYGRMLEVGGGQRRLCHYLLQPRSSLPKPADPDEVEVLAAQLHRLKTSYFTEMVAEAAIPARPGAIRLLDELRAEGVAVGVATTGSATWVLPLLDQLFGAGRFTTVVTGDDVTSPKPDPEAYRLALARLGASADAVVAVEDSGPGLSSALRARLACMVVANSYTELYQVNEADVVMDGFGEQEAPANVLADRYHTTPGGIVDVAGLRRLVRRYESDSSASS